MNITETIKKTLGLILSLSMLLTQFGCKKKENNSNSGSDAKQTAVTKGHEKAETTAFPYYSGDEEADTKSGTKKYSVDEYYFPEEIASIKTTDYNNGMLYISGNPTRLAFGKKAYTLNIESKKITEFDYEIPDIEFIYRILKGTDKDYIIYQDTKGQNVLCTVNHSDKKINKKKDMKDEFYVISMLLDVSGNLSVVKYENSQKVTLDVFDSELSLNKSVQLADKLSLSKSEEIKIIQPDGKGTIYFFTNDLYNPNTGYVIYKLDSSNNLIYKSPLPLDVEITGSFVGKGGKLYCYLNTDDSTITKITEINTDSGEKVSEREITINSNQVDNIFNGNIGDKYDFVYDDQNGIYGYTISENTSSEIINYSNNSDMNYDKYYVKQSDGNEYIMNNMDADFKDYRFLFVIDGNNNLKKCVEISNASFFLFPSFASENGTYHYYGYNPKDERVICELSDSGEINYTVGCEKFISEKQIVENIFKAPDKKAFFALNDSGNISLLIINSDGTKKSEISLGKNNIVHEIIFKEDGDYIIYGTKGNVKIEKLDYINNSLDKKTGLKKIDVKDAEAFPAGSSEYDFYYQTDECIYGCLLAEDKTDEIINFAENGIEHDEPITVYSVDENRILCHVCNEGKIKNYCLQRVE